MTVKKIVGIDISTAWAVLTALTVASWALGTSKGFAGDHVAASVAIMTVAVFKVRVVGLYFMELREAPWPLRLVFEGYCAVLLTLLISVYVLAW